MLHFEFMTTLVSNRRNDTCCIISREVNLGDLHGTINTASHVLGYGVLAYYVVLVQDELLIGVMWVVALKTSHVHRQLTIRLFLLYFHHLVIVYRPDIFHVLLVLY